MTSDIDKELPPGSGIDEDETIESSDQIHEPFDPTKIRVERSNPTIDLITTRIELSEINLSPDFQRKGGIWTIEAQSRLIESILIRIPLPAFYVDATDENCWLVVDGLQRLTTLEDFIVNQSFALRGLEFLKEWEGYVFNDLPRGFQRRIKETEVTIFSIQAGTPEEVKFNIFKRINTGGLPLSAQEIRNALNGDRVRNFLLKLVKSNEFLRATNSSIKDKRMADRECALRFLTFKYRKPSDYSKNDFDSFLNQVMRDLNDESVIDDVKLLELENDFYRAMDYSRKILGSWAFRKYYGEGYRLSPINKALFESWSVNLAEIEPSNFEKLLKNKHSVLSGFHNLLNSDSEFLKAISQATGSPYSVRTRFKCIKNLLNDSCAQND